MVSNNWTIGDGKINEKIIVVTGTGRAGKTLLSKLLGSTKRIEWIEEPCDLELVTMLTGTGKMDKVLFKRLFPILCKERINDHVLLRNANFRPNDLSSIWNYKEGTEIFERLVNVNTRDQVKEYIINEKKSFLLDMPDVRPFIDLLREVIPHVIFIHVVRNGLDVAKAVVDKGWFSDDSLTLVKSLSLGRVFMNPMTNCEINLPWWVEDGQEEAFCLADEYERAFIYWYEMLKCGNENNVSDDTILVKYEDLVANPDEVLRKLGEKIEIVETARTSAVKREFMTSNIGVGGTSRLNEVVLNNIKIKNMLKRYGYDCI